MPHLSIHLLGAFHVTLDGELVTRFKYDHVRALLAYLATETDRPHRREKLAGFLWPEQSHSQALNNLRYALYHLRQAIHDHQATPPFLLITRETLQFNAASDHWLDIRAFEQLLAKCASTNQRVDELTIHDLQSAIALYQGRFMEGFSLKESAPFDEWLLFKQEYLDRLAASALHRLIHIHMARGEYEDAEPYARQLLALVPWDEEVHRRLMYLLAASGRRNAALSQYQTCRDLLAEELGVDPADETIALYERIRDGLLSGRAEEPRRREATSTSTSVHPSTRVRVVARARELAQLDGFLDLALAGQGRVAFVTGDAGSGKTVLIGEFARRAMATHPDLIVASGQCNAHAGIGDPYLPFREILQMLTGDIEARRASGAITPEHARRLWAVFPDAVQTLINEGPHLIGRILPGEALALRAEAFAPRNAAWRAQLEGLTQRQEAEADLMDPSQTDLFEQVTRVLQVLARQYPLILVLDDLQWADGGTLGLLFHLGRRLAGHRILIVTAYRPVDPALGREEGRHSLVPIRNELQREFGDVQVDLNQADGRQFVEAFLDTEPNRLGTGFRETLHEHTAGNPLFTIELLQGLQDRGDLVQDEAGCWVQAPTLDWDELPARVEAVIAERIGRLPADWRQMLAIASVEGETFTAEVVARVQGVDEGEVIRRLSGPLSKQLHLVTAHRVRRIADRRLSCYRFRHILFQHYLYRGLDEVERARLHEAVGTELEALYGQQAAEVSGQLARHFEAAGMLSKAVDYLLQAGNRAVRLSAYEEAIALFTRGLALLQSLPDTPARGEQELALQLALGGPLLAARGWGASERAHICDRAFELCQQIGTADQLVQALFLLADLSRAQGEHRKSVELGEQMFSLVQRAQDPGQIALAHWTLGETHFFRGELIAAREHLEQAIALHDRQGHRSLAALTGPDMSGACLSWLSWTLWALGYPDQALERSREAMTLARELDHPFTLGFALAFADCGLRLLRREASAAQESVELLWQLTGGEEITAMQAWAMVFRGWGHAAQGWIHPEGSRMVEEGIALMSQGMAAWEAMGAVSGCSFQVIPLAEAYGRAGQPDQGLRVLNEALALIERTEERLCKAELRRLQGDLLLKAGADEAQAEGCYRQAIAVAHQQQARSWELRAAMSLSRLWQRQGKRVEARQVLADVYGWFTEGFDTPDLQEARALLEE
ncbi:MAG TPA: AAA family ATPase [Caldilineae bacterium]|nr:AAA family ATPase [Caldilineae bacterium]